LDTTFSHSDQSIYYRLKQIDYDGKFDYSKIAVVNLNKTDNEIIVYPNPSTGIFTIDLAKIKGNKTIHVLDVTGKNIKNLTTENNEVKLNLTGLAQGIYFLNIQTEQGVKNVKVLLE
jgi:hypothetical protein